MSSTGAGGGGAAAAAAAAAAENLFSDPTATHKRTVPSAGSPPSSFSPEPDSEPDEPESPFETSFGLPTSSLGGATISPHCTCRVPVSKSDLVPRESDETLFAIFTNQLSPKFPFVVLPPGTTVEQMRATRPFLMQVVRMVASVRNLRSMWGQSRAVIKNISDAVLIRSERSLDLLQGILVFLGFYHYFCMSHAHFNNLAHLALSLVGDMGLSAAPITSRSNEVVEENGSCRPRVVPRHQRTVVVSDPNRPQPQRTNEERRALLGVWYINSNVASVAKQLGPTRHTKYIAQCLLELEQAGEFPTDQLAVELVRIQQLTETISHFHMRDQLLDELPGIPRPPTTVYLEALQTELDRKHAALPTHIQKEPLIACHYDSARLALYVPLLAEEHYLADASLQPLETFARFTAAVRTWFADWFTVPVCSYYYLPQPASSMLVHAARNLVQWARLVGPSVVSLANTASYHPTSSSSTPSSTSTSTSASSAASGGNIPYPRFPTFMGLTSCPSLEVTARPTIISGEVAVAAQAAIDMIRAAVYAQPALRLDILGNADTLIVRFESAQKEIAAAQGGVWKNDTWNAAGDQMRNKKYKIQQWIEIASSAGADKDSVPLSFAPLPGEVQQENIKWPNEIPDGIELDFSALLDAPNDWDQN